jgi:hypothetical protein
MIEYRLLQNAVQALPPVVLHLGIFLGNGIVVVRW